MVPDPNRSPPWDHHGGLADPLDEKRPFVLDRGLDQALADLSASARGLEGTLGRDAQERVQWLARALTEGADFPEAARRNAIEVAFLLRLLDRLRARTVELWMIPELRPPVEELLRTLWSIDQVRQRLQADDEPESLASALSVVKGPELVVGLAHDLRSPLTAILFLAETLQRGQSGPLSALQLRQTSLIYSAALNLLSMASDVTELARAGSQLTETAPTSLSVSHVIASVVDLVRPMVDERNVVLRVTQLENDLRIGYPIALNRVILNLTTNSLKFTERGFVEIGARELDQSRVEFSVRDTGPGLDAELTEHLFEPFRTRPTAGGSDLFSTGLGLWICKRLVDAMGGELRFETSRDKGTTFYFELQLPPAKLV